MNSLLLFEKTYAMLSLLDNEDEYKAYRAVMEYAFYNKMPDYSAMNEKTQRIVYSIIYDIDDNRKRFLHKVD